MKKPNKDTTGLGGCILEAAIAQNSMLAQIATYSLIRGGF